jgi:hypothetical protein
LPAGRFGVAIVALNFTSATLSAWFDTTWDLRIWDMTNWFVRCAQRGDLERSLNSQGSLTTDWWPSDICSPTSCSSEPSSSPDLTTNSVRWSAGSSTIRRKLASVPFDGAVQPRLAADTFLAGARTAPLKTTIVGQLKNKSNSNLLVVTYANSDRLESHQRTVRFEVI